jgi:hypothetical protein
MECYILNYLFGWTCKSLEVWWDNIQFYVFCEIVEFILNDKFAVLTFRKLTIYECSLKIQVKNIQEIWKKNNVKVKFWFYQLVN